MLMIAEIVSTINGLAINALSSFIYDKGKKALEFKHAEQSVADWVQTFFSKHTESVFETSYFDKYIKYQKPLEKIQDYILNSNSPVTTEEPEFIQSLAADCRKYIIDAGGACSAPEESSIRDLFQGLLTLYKKILSENTSDGEKLILHQTQQGSAKMDAGFKETGAGIANLGVKLESLALIMSGQDKITDSETIENIYKTLSDLIWEGRMSEAYGFLPVLSGKNDDLENAIKIKLSILSKYNIEIENPLIVCSNICNTELKDDVFRLLILYNFSKPDNLSPYTESITSPTLKKIAESIVSGELNNVLGLSSSTKSHATRDVYKPSEGLKSEKWLTERLCLLTLNELHLANLSKVAADLVQNPNFVDQLYIWESYRDEMCASTDITNLKNTQEFCDFVDIVKTSVDKYTNTQINFQKRFYLILARGVDLLGSVNMGDFLSSIPQEIAESSEFEVIRLAQTIEEGNADQNKILDFAIQNKNYMLLIKYCKGLNDYPKVLDLINKRLFLLDENLEIFDYAMSVTEQVKGKNAAFQLLKNYENKYSDHATFWLSAYRLADNDADRKWAINSIILKIKNDKLIYDSHTKMKDLSSALVNEGRFTEAIDILNNLEQASCGDLNIVRKKINVYMRAGHQIDAFTEISNHYDELKNDIQMLNLLLYTSIVAKRSISEEIISHAKKFKNTETLMFVAESEYIRKNFDEAKRLAIQSMLLSDLGTEAFFDYAAKYFIQDDSLNNKTVMHIEANIYFEAENLQDHTRLAVCIYKDNILPEMEYHWKEALHIYIDDAIHFGFIRSTINDVISYKGQSYKIISIFPIEVFYFNVCAKSMARRGRSFIISGNTPNELVQNLKDFLKPQPDAKGESWHQIYSDFTRTPIPVYQGQLHTSNVEYAQLMRAIMEDSSIIVREYIFPIKDYTNREYVITYTALAALHKLGVNPNDFYNRIIIPASVSIQAEQEATLIYQHNNRDTVASISLQGNSLSLFESTEARKREDSQIAIDFRIYVNAFETVANLTDMIIENPKNSDISQVIGICDYDAIVLAHSRESVLVTSEMAPASLTTIDSIKSDVAGTLDFLCLIGVSIVKLFSIIVQMMKYRFYAAITPTVIAYVIKNYDSAKQLEKDAILKEWYNILSFPKELADENYLKILVLSCNETMRFLRESTINLGHPIITSFFSALLDYQNCRIECQIVDGTLSYKLVPLTKEEASVDSIVSDNDDAIPQPNI